MLRLFMLLAASALLTGCGAVERLVSDSATRLAYQIRDKARSLRRFGESRRTFSHQPKTWPDGLAGDYRIEIASTPLSPAEKHSILTAKSYDGPTVSGTSYHLNYVTVPRNLVVRHRRASRRS